MRKPPLLFLCHRIPFPPNKGDKIRSFHLLEHLALHFDVYLASFIDDPEDWQYADELKRYCADYFLRPLVSWRATLRSATGLLTGQALSIPYYSDAPLKQWVEQVCAEQDIGQVIVYSSSMAQFVPAREFERKVIDFVDVDSDKWAQYAQGRRQPMRWVYQREARLLLALEQELAEAFDAGLFVSSSEADLFHELSPGTATKVGFYNNGVDSNYFDPEAAGLDPSPYAEGSFPLVFTGAMDYWPNVDAVNWFAREIFPALRSQFADLTLTIVGGNPARQVQALARLDGVEVTGRVPDVRPYLKHCAAVVAPMRVARGVQNKVLEGMAMARPVMVSRRGLEGIDAADGEEILLAETTADYSAQLQALRAGSHAQIGGRARAHVCAAFNWDENLPEVVFLLGEDDAVPHYARAHGHG